MRIGLVGQIARKEILTTLRDRRAILSNLLLPLILLPLIMLGMPLLLGGLFSREQAAVTPVAVENLAQLLPGLNELLTEANIEPTPVDDAEAAVRSDRVSLGLVIPEGGQEAIGAGERIELVLYMKQGNLRAELAASKLTGAVDAYRQGIVADRLAEAGLDPSILEPVSVRTVDASSEAERSSGQLSWLIPFFIAIWTLMGGQMTAIDSTAGEKERGTLESLLVAPVRRREVVIGKFLATLLFGLSAAMMALVGYVAGGALLATVTGSRLSGEGAELVTDIGGSLQITAASLGLLFISTLLLAATLAALLLTVCMFARSFKEAQSYVAPLSFLLILPVLGLQFNDLLDLGNRIYLVPVVNALLLMDSIVTGSANTLQVLLTWTSLVGVVALLLTFALRNFAREDVIFRT